MNLIPISSEKIKTLAKANGIPSPGTSSIREISHLVNKIEENTGIKFIRMEMGVPGLPAPSIGIEAEIAALRSGVA
jgi:hypothetical protein